MNGHVTSSLVSALDADRGVTCVVGAGGKKSTLYALAERIDRAIVTSTVRIPPFERHVDSVRVTDDPIAAVRESPRWPIGLVAARDGPDRYRGYDPRVVDDLAAAVGEECAILVKADGARTRWLKAPKENEPQLPVSADTVVPIASVQAVGEPLDEGVVHRPERVASITGLDEGEAIRPEHVATILASERAGRKDVPADATVVPMLNMADTPALERLGREIAAEVLDRTDVPRVVIARMIADRPVVDVIR